MKQIKIKGWAAIEWCDCSSGTCPVVKNKIVGVALREMDLVDVGTFSQPTKIVPVLITLLPQRSKTKKKK